MSNLGVIRVLRKSFEKHWNYAIKKLVDVNKGGTFAPATTRDVHWNTDKHTNQNRKFIFKKDLKKACENWKKVLSLHPAKQAKFIGKLVRRLEENEMKIFKKKTSKISCQLEITFLLLHPLWETSETKQKTRS